MRKTSLHAGVDLSFSKITDTGLQHLPKDVMTLKMRLRSSKITASGLGSFAVARAGLVAIHLETHDFSPAQLQALPAKVIIKK